MTDPQQPYGEEPPRRNRFRRSGDQPGQHLTRDGETFDLPPARLVQPGDLRGVATNLASESPSPMRLLYQNRLLSKMLNSADKAARQLVWLAGCASRVSPSGGAFFSADECRRVCRFTVVGHQGRR